MPERSGTGCAGRSTLSIPACTAAFQPGAQPPLGAKIRVRQRRHGGRRSGWWIRPITASVVSTVGYRCFGLQMLVDDTIHLGSIHAKLPLTRSASPGIPGPYLRRDAVCRAGRPGRPSAAEVYSSRNFAFPERDTYPETVWRAAISGPKRNRQAAVFTAGRFWPAGPRSPPPSARARGSPASRWHAAAGLCAPRR
jgi:hypothetical protein